MIIDLTVTHNLIRKLSPFSEMSDADFNSCLTKAECLVKPKGTLLFKRGDENATLSWLVTGSLDLLDEKFNVTTCRAGQSLASSAIDDNLPHRLTAVLTETSDVLTIRKEELDAVVGSAADRADHNVTAATDLTPEVASQRKEKEVDWMSALLCSPLFEFIPPTKIQSLFARFEKVHYATDDIVIRQGEQGTCCFVLQTGRAKIERIHENGTDVLAELVPGDNFGQDALISDLSRNATVTMLSSGTLMRLSKTDFTSLLMRPVIETISRQETQELVRRGEPPTCIIDVRNPDEADTKGIPDSINIPLLQLRGKLDRLERGAVYVMACDGGKRARLGAYIMNEKGFSAYVLDA